MRLPKSPDIYDASNEQQTRRALEGAIDGIDGKLSSLLTSSGTLLANTQDLSVANGANNDVAIGYGTYTRISGPTSMFTLTGLAGGEPGRVLLLRNTTAYDMTLADESASSAAANRILTQTGADITLARFGAGAAVLVYDGASERWVVVGGSGYAPAEQVFRLHANLAGADSTSAQSIFGVGCSLAADTVYAFEITAGFTKSAGVTSHQFALLFAGTATLNSIAYVVNASGAAVAPGVAVAPLINRIAVATATNLTAAMALASNQVRFTVSGIVSCSGDGTFIPQYQLSAAPGGAYSTNANSFMRIAPIGAHGSNTSIGTWA